MMDGKIKKIGKRFGKWKFSWESPGHLVVSTDDVTAAAEIPVIVENLSNLYNNMSFTLGVHKGKTLKIDLQEKVQKKYGRMYTSGCFDVFHFGHLNILERSKELCDYLIVGVSTDDLIEREKGKRPVIPYAERHRVLESISYVDLVIPQVDKDKQKIVDQYNIDAISVGSDWKGKYPEVSCEMEYFPYTESISSTILKNTLQLSLTR